MMTCNDRGEIEDDLFQQLKDDGYTKAEIFKFIADARKKEKLVEKHEKNTQNEDRWNHSHRVDLDEKLLLVKLLPQFDQIRP